MSNGFWMELPTPPFYDPTKVGEVWRVPYEQRAQEALDWAVQHNIKPAKEDRFKIALVLTDMQNTFCLPEFELFVGGRSGMGAVDDCRRMCEFIYRNLGSITTIVATLDTHQAVQVFHPVYLIDPEGQHPSPYTLVSHEDVVEGRWRFNPAVAPSLGITPELGQERLLHYTRTLKERGKYDLSIWPYHSMLGGIGHALVSAVEEAVFFHTLARYAQASMVIKGRRPETESYSAIGPEVLFGPRGEQLGQKNEAFLGLVLNNDAVLIAGEAKSHCVAWTIEDLLGEIRDYEPGLAKKVYLLEDCATPVVVPGVVDYTEQADEAYRRFEAAGMHIIQSIEPIASWAMVSLGE